MNDQDFEDVIELIVEAESKGERIDKYLSDMLSSYSRSHIQKLVTDGNVLVDNKIIKSNYRLSPGEKVQVRIPLPVELEILPEEIPLDIIYEDQDVIVVNKPKGMVVHPSAGHYSGTLVNALMYHCKDNLSGINGVLRPGIVHRIDMDTTGLLVVCKNDEAHASLSKQLKDHTITRTYYAICYNRFGDESGTIDAPIGRHPVERKKMTINYENGKHAVTHFKVLENLNRFAYIECNLETGRTHQIRVHLSSIRHPLLGDELYFNGKCPHKLQGQTLHAGILGFVHPRTGEYMEFKAPLPEYFVKLLEILK